MDEILHIINEMSPYLLLGFLFAGLMHAFIPRTLYTKYLSGQNIHSVINAALLGIPLPLCSCGVLPTAMSLRKEGASHGAVVSFLIATPQTGVDSIIATYSLMGLPFAILRPIAALVTAVFGGVLVNTQQANNQQTNNQQTHPQPLPVREGSGHSCCCHEEKEEHCCGHEEKEEHCCCHEDSETAHLPHKEGLGKGLLAALEYAYVDLVKDIGKWLVVGLIVAALITVLVPDDWFAVFKDNTWLSMLLVLAISVPMYICATGSIPIAVALMLKGLTPGAALVLLMAGPAANMASILVIRQQLGTRTLIAYLASIVFGAIAFGVGIDYLLPREWFTEGLVQSAACCETTGTWFQWLCTGLLIALLINAFVFQRNKKCGCHTHAQQTPSQHSPKEGSNHSCCCHEEEEEEHCCCHHEEPKKEEGHCCCCHHEQ